ncbi:MAG: hypothetical protein ACOCRO_06730 [Halanaerobiales bacterium]
MKILGLLLIVYAIVVIFSAIAKPAIIWNSFKVRGFIKVLGEKGTVILFYIIGGVALLLGGLLLF